VKAAGAANGKAILLGEHAVVHGCPAIAVGLERGARAVAEVAPAGGASRLVAFGRDLVADPASEHDLGRALDALLREPARASSSSRGPVVVEATSDLPQGGGLGSSAAIAVAVARAVEALFAGAADDAVVIARAMAWERVFHGNPSGIDAEAAARGGCLRFVRGAGATSLPVAIDLDLCVGWSGRSSSTRAMVEAVAELRAREPDRFARDLDTVAALVDAASGALASGDRAALGALMTRNQAVLAGFGVSTATIDRMCERALASGALGAKLTGGGGGGSVLALVDGAEAAEAVLAAWRADGLDGFFTRVRPPGTPPEAR
jgi:mevalonate kinase